MFKGIYTASTYLEMYDAILVIDDDDSDLLNGTPNLCTINKVFQQHGLAETDNNCLLASFIHSVLMILMEIPLLNLENKLKFS